jgi:malonate transporter MadL subunit
LTIQGVALLAICTLLGAFAGDLLGAAIGVKNNVGGVGIAMLLLVAARIWLERRTGETPPGVKAGVGFWAAMYIPIVVAMAANQNVVAALKGGPVVAIAAVLVVAACFVGVPLLANVGRPKPVGA